jgi:hypothetical protein
MGNKNSENKKDKKVVNLAEVRKDRKSHAKTNAQLLTEAIVRLSKGNAKASDIILLQRYLSNKPF